MEELRESFVRGGFTEEDWEDLVNRPNLPDWSIRWSGVTSEDYPEKVNELARYYFKPRTFIEVEVRDTEANTAVGKAVLQLKEIKCPSSNQWTAKVNFIGSNLASFSDWGVLHFDDLQDFEVHFCKKADCTTKPRAKTMGYFHVERLRLLPLREAMKLDYGKDEVLSAFSDFLQDLMNEAMVRAGQGLDDEEDRKKDDLGAEAGLGRPGEGAGVPARGAVVEGTTPKFGRGPEKAKPLKKPEKGRGEDPRQADKAAREAAKEAAKALNTGHPQLVLQPRKDEPPPKVNFQKRPDNFLDEISNQHTSPGRGRSRSERSPRGREQGQQKMSGDRRGRDEDRGGGDKRKKRDRSSSSRKGRKPVRAELVIPVAKDKQRKRRRQDPDPSDDPSSHGGGKKGKKDRKRSEDDKKKRRSKKKDGRRKRKKDSRSSSSSSGSSSEVDLYGKDSQKYEALMEKSRRHPGKLLRSGLEQMSRFLAQRVGEGAVAERWRDQKVSAYLNQVLFTQHPPSVIGLRNSRELTTLSMALDLLMEQKFPELGDLLMQRMKAVEVSLTEGWSVANHQELIPAPKASLTTEQERSFAARQAVQRRRLEDVVSPRKKQG